METTAILIITTIVFTVFLYKRLFSQQSYGQPIPGPVGLPLLGSSLTVNMAKIHLSFYEWAMKYGRIFRVSLFGQGVVVLNDIDLMQKAFVYDKYADYFTSHPQSFIGKYVVYGNKDIAFALHYDKTFVTLKKMLSKALRQYSEKTKSFEMIIHEELTRFRESLANSKGQDFVLKPLVRQSFGNLMSIMLSGALPQHNDSDMIWEFNDALFYIAENSVSLMLTVLPFLRHVKLTKCGRYFQKVIEQRSWIEDRYFYGGGKQPTDESPAGLVETLLTLQSEENKKAGQEIITEDHIKSLLLDIVAGGMTSTTNAILASVGLLVDNPECAAKIQVEIDDVIGDDRLPSVDDKQNMPYTTAYILETLRYISHGSLGLPHQVAKNHSFEGFHMKKNDIVFTNIWYVHKDPKIWDDPWTFRPERFLDPEGNLVPSTHTNRQNLVTFSMGRHKCPGNEFSVGKVFLYITSILQTFNIRQPLNHEQRKLDPRNFLPGLFLEPENYLLKIERKKY